MPRPIPPDATAALLAGFSPYLRRVHYHFPTNTLEMQLMDCVEQPRTLRLLHFTGLHSLEIMPHNPAEHDAQMIDSLVGAHRQGEEFHFHTQLFSISFVCTEFHERNQSADHATDYPA